MTPPIRSPVWRPSPVRTVVITPPTFIRARGLVQKVMPLSWGLKTSADNLDYYLDASELLCCTKDYIASVTATPIASSGGEPDVAVSWVSIIDGMAALFLGGGTPGTVQQIQVDMTTQQGRVISQPMLVEIASDGVKADPEPVPTLSDGTPIPPNALLTPDGDVVTVSPPIISLLSRVFILTPSGSAMITTPDGHPILAGQYASHTPIFLIA